MPSKQEVGLRHGSCVPYKPDRFGAINGHERVGSNIGDDHSGRSGYDSEVGASQTKRMDIEEVLPAGGIGIETDNRVLVEVRLENESVVAEPAIQGVVSGAALKSIVTSFAVQLIVSVTAEEAVCPRTAEDDVSPLPAIQVIVTLAAY